MIEYRYVFQWSEKTKNVSVVGKTETEVWRTAAKIWFPHMATHALPDAVKLIRQTGGHIRKRNFRVL